MLLGLLAVLQGVREGEVHLVRPAHDAEAPVAVLVLGEHHGHRQEGVVELTVLAPVLQHRVEAALLRQRSAVQLEALAALLLREHRGQVVHAVAAADELVQVRHELWVRQQRAEGVAVRLRPAQHAAQVAAAGRAVARKRRVGLRVPQRRLLPLEDVPRVGVDAGVHRGDFLRAQRPPHDDEAVEVEVEFLRVGHPGRRRLLHHHGKGARGRLPRPRLPQAPAPGRPLPAEKAARKQPRRVHHGRGDRREGPLPPARQHMRQGPRATPLASRPAPRVT
mmetsp:Transcript_33021/g.87272  ORF Transcript_33021/g.87272 Transcript_33021/m.87272 type:complete len:278 (-) Transcript_33021:2-835(-)